MGLKLGGFSKYLTNHILNITISVFINVIVLVLFFSWTLSSATSLLNKRIVERSDFLAFYSAGRLVKEGDVGSIYKSALLSNYQSDAIGGITQEFLPFRYLRFVALFFSPFAKLEFPLAFLLFVSLNLIFILITLIIIKMTFKSLANFRLWFLLPFAYYPIMLALTKGQLSIFLMLILLMIYRLLRYKPFLAGCLFSLLLIKPQFFLAGLPFFFINFIQKKRFCFWGINSCFYMDSG